MNTIARDEHRGPAGAPRRRLVRATALALALGLAVSACGGSSGSGNEPKAGAQLDLKTATPKGTKPLDSITWNLPYEPQGIDPITSFNYAENTVLANLCESLQRLTPDFEIEPGLASKAENPTPTTWVYTIRDKVTFWDGTPLTAEDVAASLKRHLDPAQGTWWGDYFRHVKTVEATGPLQVTVTLKQPDALFNQAMATAAGAVTQKAHTTRAGKDIGTPEQGVICTGPFKFDKWRSGDSLTIVRNEHYWNPSLAALSKSITFRFIADETTAVNALRSGEIDGQYFYLPPAALGQLQQSPTGKVTLGRSLAYWALLGATKEGPYGDPKVRSALSMALDRAALGSAVFQGAAAPERAMAGPAYWGYEKDTFKAAYDKLPTGRTDLEQAEKLLADAPKGTITIGVQGSSAVHEQTGNLIKATGEKLGLKIDIRVVPVEQYGNLYNDPKAREGIDAFLSTWYGNVPDPLDAYTVFLAGGNNNFSGFGAVDADIKRARAASDPAERARIVTGIQQKVAEDVTWMPLNNLPVILYMNDRITGAVPSFPYLYYPWASGLGGK
ncbi:ABC transporter substrate-binding protein [Streptomyces solicathayae]|uniref:ABC transporter substrate-binding protein n=1 Tax=Streptomyces solicathayae TaxID=3081768 RepID=A0ABZ0LNK4_9ACTN|nr:ABC transporter substrate-binding protein [Streptomyces sp. HUAS YS2]WOX21047.1 ABC transporter substrate-binding protein [Streptomyces sp. HUAS YS2]